MASSATRAPFTLAQRLAFFSIFLLGIVASPSNAQVFKVGVGEGCTTDDIQVAIDAANRGYTIRIARNQPYVDQDLVISNKGLTLIGGYDTCTDDTPSGQTLLSGLGGDADSVITIRGGSEVTLENLGLIRGDEVYDGYGGGIDYRGFGALVLRNTALTQNYAGYGGGMSVISEGGPVAVTIARGTVIQLNEAQFSGGGIRLEGRVNLRMDEPDSAIIDNTAYGLDPVSNTARYGNGGGLQVIAPATADIGSPGYGITGPIARNTARYGGGIAIDGTDEVADASVRVYTTDPARATRIHGNRATQTGGGIHLLTDVGAFYSSRVEVCLWDARLDDNRAQNGAAVYGDSDYSTGFAYGSRVEFNRRDGQGNCGSRPARAVSCFASTPCNTIEGNRSVTATDEPTSGSTVLVQNGGRSTLRNVKIRHNEAGSLIRWFEPNEWKIYQVRLADNILSGRVLQIDDGGVAGSIDSVTIAGNEMSGAVISASNTVALTRSLIWQPGTTSASGGAVNVDDVIAHEVASLGGGPEAIIAPPRFMDPVYGDYQLQAASQGVDFAYIAQSDVNATDLGGGLRGVDIPGKDNLRGLRDVGAYERQFIGNIVLNPTFPARSETPADHFRSWSIASPPIVTWSEAEGATGSAGAVYVNYRPGIDPSPTSAIEGSVVAYTGLRQCISLPGPGIYSINAWSRVPGAIAMNRDYARIHWTLRNNSANCTGPATAEGIHYLPRSASWTSSNEEEIPVAPAGFTVNSTIELALQVVDGDLVATNPVDAWFDQVALRITSSDVPDVFSDGFENP